MDLNFEENCNAKLQNFVEILRIKATELNEIMSELNRFATCMENLSPKLTAVEIIEENEQENCKLYSHEMIEKVLSSILSGLNDSINRAHNLLRKMDKSLNESYGLIDEFTGAANVVCLLKESSMVTGTHNRKPLDHYIQESFVVLHEWKKLHRDVVAIWGQANVRNLQTIQNIKRTQQTASKCQELMDKYLLYSWLLTPNKRSK